MSLQRNGLICLSVFCAIVASLPGLAATVRGQTDQTVFKAHMAFLADDLLEGRETGTRGYDLAARYVIAQFAQFGVLPAGLQGTYYQQLPLKTSRLEQSSPVFQLQRKSGSEDLVYLDQFSMRASLKQAEIDVMAPAVFVGYGITAPKFRHDDYVDIDVRGKIVVVLSGNPVNFPTEEGAHYGDSLTKARLAASRGAIGVISLQTPRGEKRFPFSLTRWFANTLSMDWITDSGAGSKEVPEIRGSAFVSMEAAPRLFTEVDVKIDEIFATAMAGKPVPRFDLGLSAHLSSRSTLGMATSNNVVGVVEGSDPVLKHEYVVFSAHLDGLGVRQAMAGDSINNGAMDNASGVATLLEMARLLADMPVKPKRSILFLAMTGEEKGLLGSDYFAHKPTVPQAAIVANVNLDMPVLTYDFSNVIAFGIERSTLKAPALNALRKLKLSLIDDPWPEQGHFTRSDHYNFVRQGIPAIYLMPGTGSFDKAEDGAKSVDVFLQTHYHKPTDDMSLPINWQAAQRFAHVNFMLGVEIANQKERIQWRKGDFFGELFQRK